MSRSQIFYTNTYQRIEKDILKLLNSQPDFLSAHTATSTRAVGDAVQSNLAGNFQSILGDLAGEYSSDFARRAMADLAFTDANDFYYIVDVKTHNLDTHFNMPNITSVERLTRFYESDKNTFVVLMVKYVVKDIRATVKEVHFVPIEFLAWDCLTIGALGWGQIQIANANIIHINAGYPRKRWMIELCDAVLDFYPREIGKIEDRIDYFKQVKQRWEKKSDSDS